jgi:cytochrome c peroxidase
MISSSKIYVALASAAFNRRYHKMKWITFAFIAGIFVVHSCTGNTKTAVATTELGRFLFYDQRLSADKTRSCATCHNPAFSFTDTYKRSVAFGGALHQRNSQPLVNLRLMKYFTAADSAVKTLMQQIHRPFYNMQPPEMGVYLREQQIIREMQNDSRYRALFAAVYGNHTNAINWQNIKTLLVAFVESIEALNAPYDQFIKGDTAALGMDEKMGMQLFYSARLGCSSCHGGLNFATPQQHVGYYHNIGLYNIDGNGAYPAYDPGLFQNTHNPADMGKFRVPTLRQLAFTAPYFHDGSAATLTEALNVFWNGGRTNAAATGLGDGVTNPYKHPLIKPISLTSAEKMQVHKFLLSLADSTVLTAAAYSNPF